MTLHFVPRSNSYLDAEFLGHRFTLFYDAPDLGAPPPAGRWMLRVDGEIVSSFGSFNQAKHAADRFAVGLTFGPGMADYTAA